MISITTSDEKTRLAKLERVIKTGQQTFVDVGLALAEIRNDKLYRQQFSTFDDYCREKWGWKRAYAYQLIDGASAVNALPENLSRILDNAGQATELARAPEEKRVKVIEQAAAAAEAEDRPMTAKDIREAAKPAVIDIDPAAEVAPFFKSNTAPELPPYCNTLSQLKYFWGKATPADRGKFRTWINVVVVRCKTERDVA